MSTPIRRRRRWAVGTYMELRSKELLVEFMRSHDNMTCVELARAAGVSKQFISRLRRGHDKTMKPETAERIARGLKIPLAALFVEKVSPVGGQTSTPRGRAA